ncbi:MAG: N-acetyltransferase [Ignavibacteriaceae bacterium]|nr:N-acetyltransferase [Ignavibacteriaceae bacterium]
MGIILSTEKPEDYEEVINLTDLAFKDMPFSNHKEGELVHKLRKGPNFVEELSIVAKLDGKIIGHILFTKLYIKDVEKSYETLELAPVSVLPEYQRKGIGSMLINEGLKRAKEMGFKSVMVVGHPDYYPRFGFQKAEKYNIKSSIEVPADVFMAIELIENGLKDVAGTLIYPEEFA